MSQFIVDQWQSRLSVLTKKEQDIAYQMLQGMTNNEIVKEIGGSASTCKVQVHNILKKLNYASRDRMLADFIDQDLLELAFDGLTQVKPYHPQQTEIEEIHL